MTTGSLISGENNNVIVFHMTATGKGTITDKQENSIPDGVFLPSPRLKLLYLTYLFFVVWVVIMPFLMVISISLPPAISLPVSVAALLVVIIALVWIRKYYASIRYSFTTGQITLVSGVLFKKTTAVPCDMVHRVSTRRGPLQRLFGFATVDLLTTDPTVSGGSRILLSIKGVTEPVELEKRIDKCRR
jgi:membrane protein YdbS with pleckstrin-like domain